MNKTQKSKLLNLFIRYALIIIAGLGNLYIFYALFTPLTTRTFATILNIFSPATLLNNTIVFQGTSIHIIPACVAGAAFYLLFILTLATPVKAKKIAQILLFSFTTFFILNIFRLTILAFTLQSIYFNTLHLIFWYLLSTFFVVGIWLLNIKLFKIKKVPVYSDLRFVLKLIKKAK